MFIYCILPSESLKCNFIKIGYCIKYETLKKRYSTYYGSNPIHYYVKVKSKNTEKYIHEKLKSKGLHLKNELFIYNENFNLNFYTQVLNEFSCNYDFYKCRQDHIFGFFSYISIRNINKKMYIIKKEDGLCVYFEKIESIIYNNTYDIEEIWSYYLLYCESQFKQYYKNKKQFKDYIKILFSNEDFINYKNFILEIKEDRIKSVITNKINFKEFILYKYNIIVNMDKKQYFEKYLNTKNDISRSELLRTINNNIYYYPCIDIYKIIIKDYNNKELNIVKYFNFNIYINEYIEILKNINYLKEKNKIKYKKKMKWKKIDIKYTGFAF